MAQQFESLHQQALFEWASYQLGVYPDLEWLYHTPNGGKRDEKTARKLKREGVKPGVPDVFLPVARGGYHGLYIEMKHGNNKPTKDQLKWINGLKANGYKVEVCYDWLSARDKIIEYLGMD